MLGVEAELNENAGGVAGFAAGVRLMMVGFDTELREGVTGACATPPSKVGDARLEEDGEDGGTKSGATDDCPGKKEGARNGLGTAEVEHEESTTVTVDSTRTVLMPSRPVDVKMDGPFGATTFAGTVGAGARVKDDEVTKPKKLELDEEEVVTAAGKTGALDGTIPPKLKVLVGDVETNWRLFTLMTVGEAAGALRLMMGGGLAGCGTAP